MESLLCTITSIPKTVSCFRQREAIDDESHSFEYRMIDGDVVWLRDIVHVVVEGGGPTQLFGVMR